MQASGAEGAEAIGLVADQSAGVVAASPRLPVTRAKAEGYMRVTRAAHVLTSHQFVSRVRFR